MKKKHSGVGWWFSVFLTVLLFVPSVLYANNDVYSGNADRVLAEDVPGKVYSMNASWYGPGFYGGRTSSGEIYHPNRILVAHRSLPLGSCLKITYPGNGKSVVAPVLDRGPYVRGRSIDLSKKTMEAIGGKEALKKGTAKVLVEKVFHEKCNRR